jgi:acyl-CoA synthetase (AMP-forming)/AMP-acid ligase II
MASILDQLDKLGAEHPHKLLYSFLDLNGNPLESYSYAAFLQRTKAIAGHLLKDGRFAPEDRLLLAYPPGLEMICAFFGCVRAGLIPVPVYPPSSRGFQSALYKMVHIAKDCQAAGVLTSADYRASLKTNLARSGVSASGIDVDYISGPSMDCYGTLRRYDGFGTNPSTALLTHPAPPLPGSCFSNTLPARR